ncbi:MAG: metallophosphoesterase [Chitinivibrionales bacterium]|nr:metallophosphoesterase [Chitinivibrionales bacterium]
MRTALFGDIHGNSEALKRVLDDIRKNGVDKSICMGDIETLGPNPREALRLVKDFGCDVVMGNHDYFMLHPEAVEEYTESAFVRDEVKKCRHQLVDQDFEFIKTFRQTLTIEMPGGRRMYCFHGTPDSTTTGTLPSLSADTFFSLFPYDPAVKIVVCAHTHLQFCRRIGDVWLVNAGSVGQPFAQYPFEDVPEFLPHAEYAIVEVDGADAEVRLRRID